VRGGHASPATELLLRIRFQDRPQGGRWRSPAPKASNKQSRHRRRATSPRCSAHAQNRRRQDNRSRKVTCAILRRCTAPKDPTELSPPPRSATSQVTPRCRCRKRRHPDDVPHRTGRCQATPAAVIRCEPQATTKKRPKIFCREATAATRGRQQPSCLSCGGDADPRWGRRGQRSDIAANQAGSQETMPQTRERRRKAPPSLVQYLDRVFTQRPRATGRGSESDAPSREERRQGRHRHSTKQKLVRAFARSLQAGTSHAQYNKPTPQP
jgi:hypothetical protein